METIQEIAKRRIRFVYDYCKSKGLPLNPDDLTIEQIMEIRKEPDWINIPNEVEKEFNKK